MINKESQIYFAFYRHSFKSIKSYRANENELFKDLSGKTLCSIVLPLSIILSLYQSRNNNLVYRYDGERSYHCTSIRSLTLNKFLNFPEDIINTLELNSEDYIYQKVLSPKDFFIEGNKINQFPIIVISDKEHEKWVKGFIEGDYNMKEDGCFDVVEEELEGVTEGLGDPAIPF